MKAIASYPTRSAVRANRLVASGVMMLLCVSDGRAQGIGLPRLVSPQPSAVARAFPEGARIAFVSLERVASETAEGKAFTAKIESRRQRSTL